MSNANSVGKIELPVELDRPRTFRFNLGVMRKIEQRTGKNTLRVDFYRDLSATDFSNIVLSGLEKEDPTLTLEKLDEILTPTMIQEMSKVVGRAVGLALGGEEAEKKMEAPTPPQGQTAQ